MPSWTFSVGLQWFIKLTLCATVRYRPEIATEMLGVAVQPKQP